MGICKKIHLTVWRLDSQSVCFKSEVAVYGAVALDPFIDPRVVDWTGSGRAKDGVHHRPVCGARFWKGRILCAVADWEVVISSVFPVCLFELLHTLVQCAC